MYQVRITKCKFLECDDEGERWGNFLIQMDEKYLGKIPFHEIIQDNFFSP